MLTRSKARARRAQAQASGAEHAIKDTSAVIPTSRPGHRPPASEVTSINKQKPGKHTQQGTTFNVAPITVSEHGSAIGMVAPVEPLTRFQLINTLSRTSLSIAKESLQVAVLASESSAAAEQLLLKLSAPLAACFSIPDIWMGAILAALIAILLHLTDIFGFRRVFTNQALSVRGSASAADFLNVLRTMRWILERAKPSKKK